MYFSAHYVRERTQTEKGAENNRGNGEKAQENEKNFCFFKLIMEQVMTALSKFLRRENLPGRYNIKGKVDKKNV